jgi:hypothetical protein
MATVREQTFPTWQCWGCRHLHDVETEAGGNITCDAYPDGIPFFMVSGSEDHRFPLPGDHGIRFEPMAKRPKDRLTTPPG